MNYKRRFKRISISLLPILLWLVPATPAFSQDDFLNMEIELSPVLENTELLNITGLGLTNQGNGPVLLYCFLENTAGESLENLYFELTITGARYGTIIKLNQISSQPFSLEPGQAIYATNNDLANNTIPGIEERISFTGGLTSEGEEIFNNLKGSTTLPQDVYNVRLTVYQVTNAMGRVDLASSSAEIGDGSTNFSDSEIYLKTPGDVLGNEVEITNPYPQFSWEGDAGLSYRLLVVQGNGEDSPESLLQSAKSSEPVDLGGSLLQFENLDRLVEGTNFQFPTSGAQSLQKGEIYYWQVITSVQVSSNMEDRVSEIWSFKLAKNEGAGTEIPQDESVTDVLILLLGQEEYDRLRESGYKLEGIEYENRSFTGPVATQQLEEILQKIRDEELIINN